MLEGKRPRKGARTLKAAVVHEFTQPLRVEDVPKPGPGTGEIVVKIEASGPRHDRRRRLRRPVRE